MTFPPGVTLATIRIPASSIWPDGPSMAFMSLKPTRRVFHRATGEELTAVSATVQGPGTGLALTVPHSEQVGYRDADGNSVSSWEYAVTVDFRSPTNYPIRGSQKRIFIPRGTVDVDLIDVPDRTPAPSASWEKLDAVYGSWGVGNHGFLVTFDEATGLVESMSEHGKRIAYTYNPDGSVATSVERWPGDTRTMTYTYN